jgi:hypothetical protein
MDVTLTLPDNTYRDLDAIARAEGETVERFLVKVANEAAVWTDPTEWD